LGVEKGIKGIGGEGEDGISLLIEGRSRWRVEEGKESVGEAEQGTKVEGKDLIFEVRPDCDSISLSVSLCLSLFLVDHWVYTLSSLSPPGQGHLYPDCSNLFRFHPSNHLHGYIKMVRNTHSQ
jgi:hypothetical protein